MRNSRLAAVFGVALLLYALLGSSDYLMVDGAVRSLEIMRHPGLFFHGNNHLLYPVYVLGWTRLLGAFGAGLRTPSAFIGAVQLMNALAAAVTVTALCWLIVRAAGSWTLGIAGAAAFALSRAMLLHATNGAEPVTGLMWSAVAAVAVVRGVDRRSALLAAAGGACLALAMASYQSMVLIGPGLVLYVWLATPREARATSLASVLGAAAITTAAVYGWAYAHEGITAPGAMVARFVRLDGAPQVYGGLRLTKLASLPLGLAYALVPTLPVGYPGFQGVLHGELSTAKVAWVALTEGLGLAVAMALAYHAWLAYRGAARPARVAWVAGALALLGTLLPALAWDTLYEKLWLQPIALVALGTCGVLAIPASAARRAWAVVAAAAAIGAAVNVGLAVRARVAPPSCRAQADAVSRTLTPADLLVHEWDPVSFEFDVVHGTDRRTFDLVGVARDRAAAAAQDLDSARRATFARGGAVFYLGVFDLSRERWDAFLGSRAGLSYEALASERARARLVETYQCRAARVTLWREMRPAS